jgi:hypothetical protein
MAIHDFADYKHDEFKSKNYFLFENILKQKTATYLVKQFFLTTLNCSQSLGMCLHAILLSETFHSI